MFYKNTSLLVSFNKINNANVHLCCCIEATISEGGFSPGKGEVDVSCGQHAHA